MSGDLPPTVRLANDIAAQFVHRRDSDAAVQEIAGHVRSFWEPRMITELLAAVDGGAPALDPLALRAARLLR
ncbi:hypothetical protein Acsp06_64100 [Actinomycetospora sp. NBRC 106375]|uniref:formate dehydrogenase subunit delta n=1 Tax=Actinomycetospora sp. NBRC 106375 TaxID=3032207 RepID=UPI0024A11D4D|nr:formate dehydrogenase subunit delta [Actinomycetospora sp. NBRC 106375]GLZ50225.1 hypothetical protein Acsp06_64100 [Actinomycetospora sp. NBRC 106375]